MQSLVYTRQTAGTRLGIAHDTHAKILDPCNIVRSCAHPKQFHRSVGEFMMLTLNTELSAAKYESQQMKTRWAKEGKMEHSYLVPAVDLPGMQE